MTSAESSPEPPDLARLVSDAGAALRAGRPVLVADAAHREDEVDAVFAAREITPEWMAWLVRHSSGFICAPLPAARAEALDLPIMVAESQDARRTAYTVSVDAARGITTGISAADRARTAQVLAAAGSTAADLIRPGHLLPLRACAGGVLERPGHTEAAVDLVRSAGAGEVGIIAELVQDDGRMLRADQARQWAQAEGWVFLTVAQLVAWRSANLAQAPATPTPTPAAQGVEPLVSHIAQAQLPTTHGAFVIHAFREVATGLEHAVLVAPGLAPEALESPTVRIHSECLTGDAFGSLRCDCGPQLAAALDRVGQRGGAVVHLGGQEGRGIGLAAKIAAYALQDSGRDTVQANQDLGLPVDARSYQVAAAMLRFLGLFRIRLLTNNPQKAQQLREHGVEVAAIEPLVVGVTAQNLPYLLTKKHQMGHRFGSLPSPV